MSSEWCNYSGGCMNGRKNGKISAIGLHPCEDL